MRAGYDGRRRVAPRIAAADRGAPDVATLRRAGDRPDIAAHGGAGRRTHDRPHDGREDRPGHRPDRPGRIGEVMIPVRGGTEAFHAYAADERRRDRHRHPRRGRRVPPAPHRRRHPLVAHEAGASNHAASSAASSSAAILVVVRHLQADVAGRRAERGARSSPASRHSDATRRGRGEPRLQDRHRQGHAGHPRRPDRAPALARPARGRAGHRLRHPPGHPARHPGRGHLQGRRRLRVDRQRRPPLPRPAGADGPAGPQRVRRPPPGHRRQHDGRGDDPRPREAHPAHPRVVGHRRWRSSA